jgi:hypothetical protein
MVVPVASIFSPTWGTEIDLCILQVTHRVVEMACGQAGA